MNFPLDTWDISLLFAFTAVVLLITSELLDTSHGRVKIKVNRKRFRNSALVFSVFFLVTVAMRIAEIVLNI